MRSKGDDRQRRTSADVVYEHLHSEIVSLALLPGAKLSEVDVAARFGVSRQPVRDAFARLAGQHLVLVRPQRATLVRGFSKARIDHARFLRLAVEMEVIRRACTVWDDERTRVLGDSLERQAQSVRLGQPEVFQTLDREFHALVCRLGGCPLAVDTIETCKAEVDRLCRLGLDRLGLGRDREAAMLLEDHRRLAVALARGSSDEATAIGREHLGRLDETIEEIERAHADYFE